MEREYYLGGARARLYETGDPGTRHLRFLEVPLSLRGRGLGNRLLELVLRDADREGITLELAAVPLEEGAIGKKDLVRWYTGKGFVLEDDGETMIRLPHSLPVSSSSPTDINQANVREVLRQWKAGTLLTLRQIISEGDLLGLPTPEKFQHSVFSYPDRVLSVLRKLEKKGEVKLGKVRGTWTVERLE